MENKYIGVVHKTISVARLHRRAIEGAVDGMGIHRTRHHILMKLSSGEKFSSQKQLADKMGITPAAMTLALSALEDEGMIERTVSRDNRYNEISITEMGREIVEASKEHFLEVDSAMFSGL